MPIVTADEVLLLTDTAKTAGDIEETGLIAIVQDRVRRICGNTFTVDGISLASAVTFNATAATIVAGSSYVAAGFAAGDEIYLSGSYRNDGYHTISSVTTMTITITSASSVVDELSGATVIATLVRWPDDVKYAAAQLIKYDAEERLQKGGGLASQSLGPRSESYLDANTYGYPDDLLRLLDVHRRPGFG